MADEVKAEGRQAEPGNVSKFQIGAVVVLSTRHRERNARSRGSVNIVERAFSRSVVREDILSPGFGRGFFLSEPSPPRDV